MTHISDLILPYWHPCPSHCGNGPFRNVHWWYQKIAQPFQKSPASAEKDLLMIRIEDQVERGNWSLSIFLASFCRNSRIGTHGRSVKIQQAYLGMRCLSSAPVWARSLPGSHVLLHVCLQRLALSSHLFPDAPIPYSLSTAPRLYIWVSSTSVRLAADSSVWLSQNPSPLLYSYHFSPVASSFF